VDGQFHTHCDCMKGRKNRVETACYHMQLVGEYPDDFGDVLYKDEEPPSFPMFDVFGRTHYYSVASHSGSLRNHSHKRVIVSLKEGGVWKCQACPKDTYANLWKGMQLIGAAIVVTSSL
jgi:hypothetical protein